MNFKESNEGFMGGFGGKKGKEAVMKLCLKLKYERKIRKTTPYLN